MSTNSDFDRSIAAWLTDGPAELSDRVLDAALDEVHTTRQRPRGARPRRTSLMPSLRVWATAAAVVVAVGLVGLVLLQTTGSVAVPGPSALPSAAAVVPSNPVAAPSAATSAEPSAAPSAAPSGVSTAEWTAFTSARYGYSLRLPPGWTQVPKTGRWSLARTNEQPKPADHFEGVDPLNGNPTDEFSAFSALLPAGSNADAWIQAFFGPNPKETTHCLRHLDNYGPVDVQGHQATLWTEPHISTECGGTYAFVASGNRVYAFEIGGQGAEVMLMALLSTVHLPS